MSTNTFDQLPHDWQREVTELRQENARLRIRLNTAGVQPETPFDKLPHKTQRHITSLRAENMRRRIEGRELIAENTALKARIAGLIADVGDARQGVEPWHGRAVL